MHTTGDACKGATCEPGVSACNDANACTLDLCTAATATDCSHKPVAKGATCNDGQACTKGDACDGAGTCAGNGALDCNDANACTADACAEPAGCTHTAVPPVVACGDGLVCVDTTCKVPGKCGNGQLDALAEQCDDGNTKDGDGCSAQCAFEPAASCAALKTKFPKATNGLRTIDPDGVGPLPALELYCDMDGGWTLLANLFDSVGDDVPNLPADVTAGWQQAGDGQWQAVAKVDRNAGGTGSAAVGLAFAAGLAQGGATKLRMCFVDKNGADASCRTSPVTLKLVGKAKGNAALDAHAATSLVWSYGHLAGLPAQANGFAAAGLVDEVGCIAPAVGSAYEFGLPCAGTETAGLCETQGSGDQPAGVWCAKCGGMCLRPDAKDDGELWAGAYDQLPAKANPLSTTWGFRLYVSP